MATPCLGLVADCRTVLWIPACAGKTEGALREGALSVIPAQAGIQQIARESRRHYPAKTVLPFLEHSKYFLLGFQVFKRRRRGR